MTISKWQWFGQAGHFIAANRCRFHLHTHVGKWCISTVGDYYEGDDPYAPPTEIGIGRLYETMVFELDENGEIKSHIECDLVAYNDRDDANSGHTAMCRKCETQEEHVARLQDELIECDREQEP